MPEPCVFGKQRFWHPSGMLPSRRGDRGLLRSTSGYGSSNPSGSAIHRKQPRTNFRISNLPKPYLRTGPSFGGDGSDPRHDFEFHLKSAAQAGVKNLTHLQWIPGFKDPKGWTTRSFGTGTTGKLAGEGEEQRLAAHFQFGAAREAGPDIFDNLRGNRRDFRWLQ